MRERLAAYERQTQPLVDYYRATGDARGRGRHGGRRGQ